MRPHDDVLEQPIEFEFMSPDEWHEFNSELRHLSAISPLDVDTVAPGHLVLGDGRRVGLLNLAQLCHLVGRDQWQSVIEEHFVTVSSHLSRPAQAFSTLDLRVRIVPDDHADRRLHRRLVTRPFAEGALEMMAVRTDDGVRAVHRSEIRGLGAVDDLWASAWAQTRTLERPDELNIIDVDGAKIHHLFSEHFFGASFVPYIDDIVEGIGEHGALVSFPVRHSVLVHPIQDGSVVTAAQSLIPITRQVHRNGPGSVSAHLYWWQAGHLTWIPTYFAADGSEFYPPAELAELIDRLDDVI